ncbi:hypothetical protein QRE62_10500 [Bacillus mycoides]|uniref:hypothetical protein n=1 Tax=Bacillus TaxID=1386 RepID=UPI0015EC172E|nr:MULTISPECIES: hypothetical protein [Bacillus]MBJ7957718.1 hypothetical protein [Bacillus cereus group sp. N28]MDI6531637.1 hypothetical protein [Bacillus mycoides]MED1056357.1 hypothetical protein [Bacillus mycoides]WJE59671.1 hypothetical protein QRE64_06545 [Bacillus mycoides]WJE65605.1 hypothetical protein QRE63_06790 [Bacillus mycoides]
MIYAWARDKKDRPKLTQRDYERFKKMKDEVDKKNEELIKLAEEVRKKNNKPSDQ